MSQNVLEGSSLWNSPKQEIECFSDLEMSETESISEYENENEDEYEIEIEMDGKDESHLEFRHHNSRSWYYAVCNNQNSLGISQFEKSKLKLKKDEISKIKESMESFIECCKLERYDEPWTYLLSLLSMSGILTWCFNYITPILKKISEKMNYRPTSKFEILQVLLLLFYERFMNQSPSSLFRSWESPTSSFRRPKILVGLTQKRYSLLLKCLNSPKIPIGYQTGGENVYAGFTSGNASHIQSLLDSIGRFNMESFTLQGASEFAFDDDQHVGTSIKELRKAGYKTKHVPGKKSKTGIVMNCLVSSLNIWIGGYYELSNDYRTSDQKFSDFVNSVLKSTSSNSIEGMTFSLDRGYSQIGKLKILCYERALFICTIRNASLANYKAPFTIAGKQESSKYKQNGVKVVDPSVQDTCCYASTQFKESSTTKLKNDLEHQILYCGYVANKNKFITLATNLPHCRPGQVTGTPSSRGLPKPTIKKRRLIEYCENVRIVTSNQRDAIWFLMRKFSITSTSANSILQILAGYVTVGNIVEFPLKFPDLDEKDFQKICDLLHTLFPDNDFARKERNDMSPIDHTKMMHSNETNEILNDVCLLDDSDFASQCSNLRSPCTMNFERLNKALKALPALGIHVSKTLDTRSDLGDTILKASQSSSLVEEQKRSPLYNERLTSSKTVFSPKSKSADVIAKADRIIETARSRVFSNVATPVSRVSTNSVRLIEHSPTEEAPKRQKELERGGKRTRRRQPYELIDAEKIFSRTPKKFSHRDPMASRIELQRTLPVISENAENAKTAIVNVLRSNLALQADISSAVIQKAFLPKLETPDTRLGLDSESCIVEALNDFLKLHSEYQLLDFEEMGLVCSKFHHCYQASVDRMANLVKGEELIGPVILEMKTFSGVSSISDVKKSKQRFGSFVEKWIDFEEQDCFRQHEKKIPLSFKPHLIQCAHHASVYNLENCLLVSAICEQDTIEIYQVVRYRFSESFRDTYNKLMIDVCDNFLGWASRNPDSQHIIASEMSNTSKLSRKHRVAMPWEMLESTAWLCKSARIQSMDLAKGEIERTLQLQRSIWKQIEDSGYPPTRSLKPQMVSIWNMLKPFVDIRSQIIARHCPRHKRPETHLKVIGRIVCNMVLNSAITYFLINKYEKISKASTLDELKMLSRSKHPKYSGLDSLLDDAITQMPVSSAKEVCGMPDPRSQNESDKTCVITRAIKEAKAWSEVKLIPALRKVPSRGSNRNGSFLKYFQSDIMIDFRLLSGYASYLPIYHISEPIDRGNLQRTKVSRCALCCETCEKVLRDEDNNLNDGTGSRKRVKRKRKNKGTISEPGRSIDNHCKREGCKISTICTACKVPLCTSPRLQWNGRSCFDVWHKKSYFVEHPYIVERDAQPKPKFDDEDFESASSSTRVSSLGSKEMESPLLSTGLTTDESQKTPSPPRKRMCSKFQESVSEKRLKFGGEWIEIPSSSNRKRRYQDSSGNDEFTSKVDYDKESAPRTKKFEITPHNLQEDFSN